MMVKDATTCNLSPSFASVSSSAVVSSLSPHAASTNTAKLAINNICTYFFILLILSLFNNIYIHFPKQVSSLLILLLLYFYYFEAFSKVLLVLVKKEMQLQIWQLSLVQ